MVCDTGCGRYRCRVLFGCLYSTEEQAATVAGVTKMVRHHSTRVLQQDVCPAATPVQPTLQLKSPIVGETVGGSYRRRAAADWAESSIKDCASKNGMDGMVSECEDCAGPGIVYVSFTGIARSRVCVLSALRWSEREDGWQSCQKSEAVATGPDAAARPTSQSQPPR